MAGKLNRGLSVIDSLKLLKDGRELTDDEIFHASAVGWCIEWVCLHSDSCHFSFPLLFSFSINHNGYDTSAILLCIICNGILTPLFIHFCSFKHIFSFLMISWIALIHVGVSPAGSDYQRCEPRLRVILFLVQFSF